MLTGGTVTDRDRQIVLDDISRSIIEQLQEDGRRSYARIASAVGLSEAAVRQRVQRLLDTVARIRSVEGVELTETFVYLGLRKQTYAWGTRRADRASETADLPAEG